MKTSLSKSNFPRIHLSLLSFTAMLLFLTVTDCALSRQFIRTNTGHGYGPGYSTTTLSSEWDFLKQGDTVTEWEFEDFTSGIQDSECRVGFSPAEKTERDIEMNHIQMTPYPTTLYPRGIYTTGTGIIIVVDLYK